MDWLSDFSDLIDERYLVTLDVDLMKDKFAKHWITMENAFYRIGAPDNFYLRVLNSKTIGITRFVYYTLCDVNQIDLSSCVIDGLVDKAC